ncbi:MAG: carbohydrate ABC transporter permease, partial [Candidatus Bipolaricaulota bacterium]
FIGLKNYGDLFSGWSARFRQDLVNAVFYTLFLVSGALGIGLILAILLDRGPKGESVFRTIFLYPMSLSFIVTGTIWRWLLAPRGGVNKLPEMIGLLALGFRWLNSTQSILIFNWQNLPQITAILVAVVFFFIAFRQWKSGLKRKGLLSLIPVGMLLLWAFWGAKFTPEIFPTPEPHGFNLAMMGIIITAIWQYSGYTMALYLAGLRGISEDLREASRLDGANQFQYYFRVAIPILKPMTMSAIIILAHISLKMFALIFAMTGPDNAETSHPAVLMYLTTFRANNFAKGAAIAVVLFVMVAVFIVPYLVSAYRERRA